MKTVVIHGQSHQGSTYHIARSLADKLGGEVTEFFLPRDFDKFCVGCTNCFMKGEEFCPHYEDLTPIRDSLREADVIILASPVYVFHATGQMKALLDHFGYRWMVHRPHERMFTKQGVCISTAAGGGMKSTNKDMKDSLFFWGVGRIHTYGKAVQAVEWNGVPKKIRQKIDKDTDAMAARIKAGYGHIKPGIKTRALFFVMHLAQRKGICETDVKYWKEKGWTGKDRPWKQEV